MIILNGKEVAQVREKQIQQRVAEFQKKYGKSPGLAVVMVGDDPASQVYVRNKEKACERVGIASARFDVDKDQNVEELDSVINRLNADRDVHGVLVQIPLPKPFDFDRVLGRLNPLKDADGLTYENMGLFWSGRPRVTPCTPQGVMVMLQHYGIDVAGLNAVVVGRSNIVGKPMAQHLLNANASVTLCHSKTKDLRAHTAQADLVVVAAGKPRMLGKDDFKKDAVVIDVGIHRDSDNKLCGDVRFDELDGWVKACTPVPRGVGPMTITMLLENTLTLAEELEKHWRH